MVFMAGPTRPISGFFELMQDPRHGGIKVEQAKVGFGQATRGIIAAEGLSGLRAAGGIVGPNG
jgi:hypothetical protein